MSSRIMSERSHLQDQVLLQLKGGKKLTTLTNTHSGEYQFGASIEGVERLTIATIRALKDRNLIKAAAPERLEDQLWRIEYQLVGAPGGQPTQQWGRVELKGGVH